jgi:hypothetical protein
MEGVLSSYAATMNLLQYTHTNTDLFHDALAFFLFIAPLFNRLVPFLRNRYGR